MAQVSWLLIGSNTLLPRRQQGRLPAYWVSPSLSKNLRAVDATRRQVPLSDRHEKQQASHSGRDSIWCCGFDQGIVLGEMRHMYLRTQFCLQSQGQPPRKRGSLLL